MNSNMGGLAVNMQRGFTSGLFHSSTAALHTFASPVKVVTSHKMPICHDEFDTSQDVEMRETQDLLHCAASIFRSSSKNEFNMQSWKVLRQGEHSLLDRMIPDYAWRVLRKLKERGYEAYLVGGSVRDMLLNQAPKDFDVLTTAEPKQVKKDFYRSMIVGKRFPICQVHVQNKIIEVSSFSTVANVPGKSKILGYLMNSELDKLKNSSASDRRHYARWENSLKRDFTINGLLYDPFKQILYDYVGGIQDLDKMKVRTVQPANESFAEDSARILRALRIAARLGFKFSRDTALAIQSQSSSIRFLNKDRLRMEAHYMLSYGAAERSLRLLWRFGLLEILLPPQAAYLADQGFRRQEKGSNMLLDLLANLDRLVSADRPCHSCLWVNLFALHLALVRHPQSPVVVSALALAIYGNKTLEKAVRKAMKIHKKFDDMVRIYPEVNEECLGMARPLIKQKALQLRDDSVNALHMMSNSEYVSNAMSRHPQAQCSDVVIVTKQLLGRCEELFLQVGEESEQIDVAAQSEEGSKKRINSVALEQGAIGEVSFVFSHIVMSTLYPHAGERRKESS